MKKLPKMYKNENTNLIDHNIKSCLVEEVEEDNQKIEDSLFEIFHSFAHPYYQKVSIKTKNKDYDTYLIARTKQTVFTVDNEEIPIKDILSIEQIER